MNDHDEGTEIRGGLSAIGASLLNGVPGWHVFPSLDAVRQLAQEIEERRQALLRRGVSEERIQRWLDQARDVYTTTAESPRDALDRFYVDLLRELLEREEGPAGRIIRQAAERSYPVRDIGVMKRTQAARDEAARKAIGALGRYKFERFGYHAAVWVNLNRLLPPEARAKSPFKHLVKAALADPDFVLAVLDDRRSSLVR